MATDSTQPKRRLAAILEADVVGYSRLMSENEERTLSVLNENLLIFQDVIPQHEGRIFGSAGDSVIAEFQSAVEAVRAAVEIQKKLAHRNTEVETDNIMQFRIGISVGDVIVEGDNLMGEGVNIAARLENLAEPGGINITGYVYQQIHNKVSAGFVDAGRQKLKNIPNPVQVYRVVPDSSVTPASPKRATTRVTTHKTTKTLPRQRLLTTGIVALTLVIAAWFSTQREVSAPTPDKEKPSVAVLPFTNMSGDPEQEYFVDGITEDIVTDISRLSSLTVIAWNTSANYKGKKVQPQEVGKELGVTYILDDSVRKAGDRLRITAKLVDTMNGNHIWAERYDRKLTEIFALQDEVTNKIVNALAIKVTAAEKENLTHTGTNNIAAYDAFLQGQQYTKTRSNQGYDQTMNAYQRAIQIDPNYARVYGAMAVAITRAYRYQWTDLSLVEARERALELAKKAVELNKSTPEIYWSLAYTHVHRREYDAAETAAKKSVALSPNYADGWALLANIENWRGKGNDALTNIKKAIALNPHHSYQYTSNVGLANYNLGRYEEAVTALTKALERNVSALNPRLYLAASYVRLNRMDDAEWQIDQIIDVRPDATLSNLDTSLPFESKTLLLPLLEDLRKAGLPE